MLLKSKGFLIVCALVLGFQAMANTESFLTEDNTFNKILKEIAKKRIQGGLNIFKWDQIDGLNLSLRYKLIAEPSYVDGYYTRVDRYNLEANINPGSWFDGWSGPIGFSVNAGSEVLFARQFKSQMQALNVVKNPPYDLRHLPLSAQKAIQKLQVGDFVSMTGNLNLVLSAEAFSYASSVIDINGSAYVLLMGQFNIHFYKLSDNHIRLKVIANRQQGYGAGINSSEFSGFKALGIGSAEKYVGGKIKRVLNFNPISINWSKRNTDLVMIDYVFDLKNPDAVAAYDHFMSAKMRLKQIELLNPLNNIKDLQGLVFSDLTQIEKIAWQDREKPEDQRRIDRLFKGRSFTESQNRGFRFGLRIIDFDSGTNSSTSKNIIADKNNNEQFYLFDTKNPYTKFRLFWDLYGDDTSVQTSLLFQTDKDFEPIRFSAFNVTKQKVIRSVSRGDFFDIKSEVESILPKEVANEINWQNWNFTEGDLVNGFFTDEVFFKTKALSAVYNRNPQQIRHDLEKYLLRVGTPLSAPSKSNGVEDRNCSGAHAKIECYEQDIQIVAFRLADVLNPNNSVTLKREALLYLNENDLFQERGAGFLLSIIPPHLREQVVSYSMNFRAKGAKDISFKYGNFEENDIYRQLLYILGVLNNKSYDLRLFVGDDQGYKPGLVNQGND